MTLLSGDTITVGAGILRILQMSAYVIGSLTGLIAVGLFFSSCTEVPIAAMAGTAIVPAVCTVLLAVPQLEAIQPALLTDHWLDVTTFLFAQPDMALIRSGLLLQLAWVAIFGSLVWARVVSQDVTA
jgi:ABC-2 type transport system permease protein